MNVSKIIEDITDRKKLRLQDLIRNIKKAIWERNI
jgi:chaperonin GroEL (HSP60 family)